MKPNIWEAQGFLKDLAMACRGEYKPQNQIQFRAREGSLKIGELSPIGMSLLALRSDLAFAGMTNVEMKNKAKLTIELTEALVFGHLKATADFLSQKDINLSFDAKGFIYDMSPGTGKDFEVEQSHPLRQLPAQIVAIIGGETDPKKTGVSSITEPDHDLSPKDGEIICTIDDERLKMLWSLTDATMDIEISEVPIKARNIGNLSRKISLIETQIKLCRDIFWTLVRESNTELPGSVTIGKGWKVAGKEPSIPIELLLGGMLPPGFEILALDDLLGSESGCGDPNCQRCGGNGAPQKKKWGLASIFG